MIFIAVPPKLNRPVAPKPRLPITIKSIFSCSAMVTISSAIAPDPIIRALGRIPPVWNRSFALDKADSAWALNLSFRESRALAVISRSMPG